LSFTTCFHSGLPYECYCFIFGSCCYGCQWCSGLESFKEGFRCGSMATVLGCKGMQSTPWHAGSRAVPESAILSGLHIMCIWWCCSTFFAWHLVELRASFLHTVETSNILRNRELLVRFSAERAVISGRLQARLRYFDLRNAVDDEGGEYGGSLLLNLCVDYFFRGI